MVHRLLFPGAVLRPSLAPLLAVVLTACAPIPPGSQAEAIVGGTTDGDDPSVVALYAVDGNESFLCTASVIAPRVLLTAAHCVSEQLHSKDTKYSVFFGGDFNKATQASLHEVAEVHGNPDWDFNHLELGHDVGIVVLRDPAPVAALPLRRDTLDSTEVGASLRLVGYGASTGQPIDGTGLKRQTSTPLDGFDFFTLFYKDAVHLTCNGDSGGPALLVRNGVEEIVGITSFGDQLCKSFGVDTRVDMESNFIDAQLEAASASATPATSGTTDPAAGGEAGAPATASHGGCDVGAGVPTAPGALVVALAALALVRRRARSAELSAARRRGARSSMRR